MTPKERLNEAVEAMRNIRGISSAVWEKRYPSFAEATTTGPLLTNESEAWPRRIQGMQIELQLRTAEYLLTL